MRRDECRVRQCDLHIINDSSVLESTVIMAEVADFILLMFGSGEISVASHFSIWFLLVIQAAWVTASVRHIKS